MAKETEGERSEHRHTVTPRQRRRFSSAEVVDLITALFVLLRYTRQGDAGLHPSLLAHALAIEARILGVEAENVSRATTPEVDDDGTTAIRQTELFDEPEETEL